MDLVALLTQRPGEMTHALGGPQQRRLGIAAGLVCDDPLEEALRAELKREERELDQLCDSRFNAVSSGLVVEMMVAFDRIRRIQQSLADTKETLRALERDRDSWRILPDDAPDEKAVDLKAVRRGESGVARTVAPDRAR